MSRRLRRRMEVADLEAELGKSAAWAVTYGDVMSYLMIFFLMLFAYGQSKNVASEFATKALGKAFGKNSKAIEEIFEKKGIQQVAKMDIEDDKIRLSFNSPVMFASGSVELQDAIKGPLTALAEGLMEIPNAIQIEGHTDIIPPGKNFAFQTNFELSSARAFSVLRFFVESGIPPERLSATGYGEYHPIADNATKEGRLRNRRIEVNILKRGY